MVAPMKEMTLAVKYRSKAGEPRERALPAQPCGAAHDSEAKAGKNRRQTEAKDNDQHQSITDTVEMQCRQQHDDGGRTWRDASAHGGDDGAGKVQRRGTGYGVRMTVCGTVPVIVRWSSCA